MTKKALVENSIFKWLASNEFFLVKKISVKTSTYTGDIYIWRPNNDPYYFAVTNLTKLIVTVWTREDFSGFLPLKKVQDEIFEILEVIPEFILEQKPEFGYVFPFDEPFDGLGGTTPCVTLNLAPKLEVSKRNTKLT